MADYFLFCRLSGALVSNTVCIRHARDRVDYGCAADTRVNLLSRTLGIPRPQAGLALDPAP
jgi:hypothetical protein